MPEGEEWSIIDKSYHYFGAILKDIAEVISNEKFPTNSSVVVAIQAIRKNLEIYLR